MLRGDVRRPEVVHQDIVHDHMLDLTGSGGHIAVLLTGALHFVADDDPLRSVNYLKKIVPRGSFLVVTHATTDVDAIATSGLPGGLPTEQVQQSLILRSGSDIDRFVAGLNWHKTPPGLVPIQRWFPNRDTTDQSCPFGTYTVVARKGGD
jgi:hypothetical protein